MTASDTTHQNRAMQVAVLGFVLQVAAFATLAGLAYWARSEAIGAVARLMVAGFPIWAVLFLVFKQLRRVQAEQMESAELRRAREAGGSSAIFDVENEELLVERHRLRWMVRWFLPSTTIVVAAVFLIGHFLFWRWSLDDVFKPIADGGIRPTENPTLVMWFVVGVGLLCFLFSRYVLALSRFPDWRLLHGGASFLAGAALACLCLAVALMATGSVVWAEPVLCFVLRWAMIVLGIEMVANFILDLYRPRNVGVVARPSFDSQLLGLVTEPGGLAKSIAQSINYQFGFEVSSTWFYQLLQRWMLPILVVACLVVIALTGVVVVDADESAVIERFGRPLGDPGAVLQAGLHFKWPYPVDIVHRAPVKRLNEMVVGEATKKGEDEHQAVLWTEAHDYVPELMILVAAPKTEEAVKDEFGSPKDATRSVAVSLLMVSVPVEYRIKDLRQYLYTFAEPNKVLEAIAYHCLSDFAARVDLDTLMGPGRSQFNDELREQIQRRADDLKLGIEVAFVGMRGAHPPSKDDVAKSFQGAIASQTNKLAVIKAAEGEARKTLTAVAGSEARALAIDEAIRERDRIQTNQNPDPQALADAVRRVDELLIGDAKKSAVGLGGEAAALISDARGRASERISGAAAKVRSFSTEIAAFEAAPNLYRQRKMLEVYRQLEDIRKYVILGDAEEVIVEYETAEQGGLDRVLDEGLEKDKKQR